MRPKRTLPSKHAWPRVTFLLPVYNEQEHLEEALESIAAQDYPTDLLEILLAEGGSTDGTKDVVGRFVARHPRLALRLLANPERNTSVGRNLGLRAATGEAVLNFSGHAAAAPQMVRTLAEKLAQQPPEVVGVGCAIRSEDGGTVVGRAIAAALRSTLGGAGTTDSAFYAARDCDARSIAFCLYRRDAVVQMGGFDANFWCGQDAELNLRLARAGYRLRFTPDTHVVHYKRATLTALARQMFRYGIARAKLTRKFPGSLRALFLLPALWVVAWLAAGIGSISSSTVALATAKLATTFAVISGLSCASAGGGLTGLLLGSLVYATIYTTFGVGFLAGFFASPKVPNVRGSPAP